MKCHKCGEPSVHSISMREGEVPFDPGDPKTPDKSHVRVYGFCGQHWEFLMKYIEVEYE